MSFSGYKSTIAEGDTALVYIDPNHMYTIKVKANEVFQTRFGALKHDDIIGKRYGSKIQCQTGFVHLLDMTPDLWTDNLPHRTQILYGPDISLILMQLGLRSGSVVVEAGTGSGSLTHSIARTIAPHGRLFSFDFHQERVELARQQFADHGIDSVVTVQLRDVCADGFDLDTGSVDAVFLDLPHPWEAIQSAKSVLNPNGGRICCFSPCVEQVQKSCQVLHAQNFFDIETYECVLRPSEVRKVSLKRYEYRRDRVKSNKVTSSQPDADGSSEPEPVCDDDAAPQTSQAKRAKRDPSQQPSEDPSAKLEPDSVAYTVSYMKNEVAGHTGFLTFASLY